MASLLVAVRDGALKRPLLLLPLAGGPAVFLAFGSVFAAPGGGSQVVLKVLLGSALTVAITALFAESWLREDGRPDAGGLLETAVLFLLPYPLLMLFSALTTAFVYALLRGSGGAIVVATVYGVVIAGKLIAFAGGVVSALAAARRREARGVLEALGLGWATARANARALALVVCATYLFQESAVYLAANLAPSAFLSRLLTTAVPLFGCVAAPIEAWRGGRLTKA